MKLTRISTDNYNGQSRCKRCGFVNWACMMVEFKEIEGHYCYKCAEKLALSSGITLNASDQSDEGG